MLRAPKTVSILVTLERHLTGHTGGTAHAQSNECVGMKTRVRRVCDVGDPFQFFLIDTVLRHAAEDELRRITFSILEDLYYADDMGLVLVLSPHLATTVRDNTLRQHFGVKSAKRKPQ